MSQMLSSHDDQQPPPPPVSEKEPWVFVGKIVRAIDKAGLVHRPHEHLEADDGVDDDDEDDKEGDLDEGKERHHDCVEHNLFNLISFQV